MLESTPPSGNSLEEVSERKCAPGSQYVRKSHFEAFLNLFEHVLIVLAADKGDAETLSAEASGTTDSVKVGVGISRKIVVDGKVDALNVDATTEDIGSNTDALVELLEFFVAFDAGFISTVQSLRIIISPFLLTNTGMDSNAGEIALSKELVKLGGTKSTLDKDDDLIELKIVEEII